MNDGPDEPTDPNLDPELLRSLVTEALDRGHEDASAIDRICARHPEYAAALRRRIRLLRGIGLVDNAPAAAEAPERLGEFRLEERIGGGGMGVVYRAEQPSLGRHVALKVIRPDQLYFDGARERFAREVEIVARLQHPCIVPVFAVGRDRGVPYFAMEYIRGCTLEEALAELGEERLDELEGASLARAVARRAGAGADSSSGSSGAGGYLFAGTWEQCCLRVTALVADALAHAHEQGVLHRDVKPSNVMITPHGRVMLLDFGLAQSEGGTRVTASASRLGSLLYMAPEHLEGDAATQDLPSRDVYSLGVTLYQLLTLRPPFEGRSAGEIIRHILEAAPARPRALNPRVSADAETVCLTALERDPRRRYPTAADLANDLRRVLERRPITAQRRSVPTRVWRWAERHPARAVAAGLAAVLVVGGPLGFALLQAERNRALERAQEVTNRQMLRAENNLDLAIATIYQLIDRFRDLAYLPRMERLQRSLLEDALRFSEALAQAEEDDPRTLRQKAEIHYALTKLLADVGRLDEALDFGERAVAMGERLVATAPEAPVHHVLLADATARHARTLNLAGDWRNAMAYAVRGERQARELIEVQRWSRFESQDTLANVMEEQAEAHRNLGDLDAADDLLDGALAIRRELRAQAPDDPLVLVGLIVAHFQAGMVKDEAWRPPAPPDRAAATHYERALELIDALERLPEVNAYAAFQARSRRAFAWFSLGRHHALARRFDEASDHHERAAALFGEIWRDFPTKLRYGEEQITATVNLAEALTFLDRRSEARARFEEALELLDALERAVPRRADHVALRAQSNNFLGSIAQAEGDLGAAERGYDAAVSLMREAQRMNPDSARYRRNLTEAMSYRIELWITTGDHARAAELASERHGLMPDGVAAEKEAMSYIGQCAWRASEDPDLTAEERRGAVEAYGARCAEHAARLDELGWGHFDKLEGVDRFEAMLGSTAFRAFLDRRTP